MNIKKYFCIIITLVVLLGSTIAISSCSKDDNDVSSNSIVGTWSCNNHYYGGSDTFTFKSNGTYTWSYRGTADWFNNETGNYAYDPLRSTLTIQNKKGTTWVYVVISLTSSSFTIMDEDGDTYFYQKK